VYWLREGGNVTLNSVRLCVRNAWQKEALLASFEHEFFGVDDRVSGVRTATVTELLRFAKYIHVILVLETDCLAQINLQQCQTQASRTFCMRCSVAR